MNPRPKALLSGFYMRILPISSRIADCRRAGLLTSYPLHLPLKLRASFSGSLFYDARSKAQTSSEERAAY